MTLSRPFCLAAFLTTSLIAQCGPQWQPIGTPPALAGIVFDQQVVPFELGAGGNLTAISSTNALQLTIGSF